MPTHRNSRRVIAGELDPTNTTNTPARYLVLDVEATCDNQRRIPRGEMEIIEIGACMVEADCWPVVDAFCTFVRPVRHPRLTPFCTHLTSIQQADVDAAPGYVDAIQCFRAWLYPYTEFSWGSWGDYDRKRIHQDLRLSSGALPDRRRSHQSQRSLRRAARPDQAPRIGPGTPTGRPRVRWHSSLGHRRCAQHCPTATVHRTRREVADTDPEFHGKAAFAATHWLAQLSRELPPRPRPSEQLAKHRDQVAAIVAKHKGASPRAFGSVLDGTDTADSDLDLLISNEGGMTLLDPSAMSNELHEHLGVEGDVVTEGGLQGPMRDRVLAEARPL